MPAKLRFHGAAREVTGSMHLIELNGRSVALDCGLNQGRRAEANAKNKSFPRDPAKIDAVILSHAHIDHCGKLPRLVKEGFSGPVYGTPATCDLAAVLLDDSAKIQVEDAEYWNKKRVKRGDDPIEPLYTHEDVEATVRLFRKRDLNMEFEVIPGLRASLHEAGHMLGSSTVSVTIDNGTAGPTRIVYTGDIGRRGLDILRDPAPLPPCDYLICESTYGGRDTSPPEDMTDEFAEIINDTMQRGGKLIIPAFAVGRTQVLVYKYHVMLLEGKIPHHYPLIVDSPLALRATEVFKNHPEVFDREASAFNSLTGDMLRCKHDEYIEDVEQSKALHKRNEPMVILSTSGMCEVGRILHHLKNNVENYKNTILIVGYQAAHTLGRRIVEKQKQIKIFGEMYDLKARVKVLTGFSAHANAAELIEATQPLVGHVKKVFLIHGEVDQQDALAARMREAGFKDVVIPEANQSFELNGANP
ncbi:MAG: MBL fold metallo-hydrolase [Phycisphaerales bacterium]|nr:MBL fold metallo-hydrolase [Phycisphaerales bacterium]